MSYIDSLLFLLYHQSLDAAGNACNWLTGDARITANCTANPASASHRQAASPLVAPTQPPSAAPKGRLKRLPIVGPTPNPAKIAP